MGRLGKRQCPLWTKNLPGIFPERNPVEKIRKSVWEKKQGILDAAGAKSKTDQVGQNPGSILPGMS